MWIISLDEGGHFEQNELRNSEKMLIGGAVFVCDRQQDVEKEAARLEAFFRAACEKNGCTFPEDLHYNRDWQDNILNKKNCDLVKETLLAELPDFMRGTGAWKDNPPLGQYKLYAIAGDAKGMSGELCRSNFIRDSVASNRYEHMAYRVIKNLLFYNIHANDDDVRLDLATRVYKVCDKEIRKDAETIGANRVSGTNRFKATTSESYRTMLLETVTDSSRRNIQIDLNVESINYNSYNPGQLFLYLADTLCSGYEKAARREEGSKDVLQKLANYSESLLGKGNGWFWAYNEIDIQYRDAMKYCQLGMDFEALRTIGTIRKKEADYAKIYDNLWLKAIENEIVQAHRPDQRNAELLDAYLHSDDYDLDVAKNILEGLYKQAAGLDHNERNARYLCSLGKSEMTYCNHTGQFEKAEECYQKVLRLMHYLPVEEVIDLRNMRSVERIDALRIDEALKYTEKTVEYADLLSEIKKDIFPDVEDRNLIIGRTYSQLGQCYAFHKEYQIAIEKFQIAIANFGSNQGNIGITRSYLLHACIECGNLLLYREQAELYFGADDLEKQLENVLSFPAVPQKFALYIYVKALYFFYRDQLDADFVRRLLARLDKAYQQSKDNHPWEMIFKYCILLGIMYVEKEEKQLIRKMASKMESCVDTGSSVILEHIISEAKEQVKAVCNHQANVFQDSKLTFMHR